MSSAGPSLASWLVPVLVVPVAAVGLWAALTACTGRHSVENARYTVLRRLSSSGRRLELRRYPRSLVASVDVHGEPDLGRAQSRGFREVAAFIFGANRAVGVSGPQPVAMTAPVVSQVLGASAPVAMTAPVVSQALPPPPPGDEAALLGAPVHRISFVMPAKFAALAELPEPTSAAVRLRELPPRTELVELRSGLYPDAAARDAAAARLLDAAAREGLHVIPQTPVSIYNYDPPWAMPLMRLSECAVQVEDPDSDGAPTASPTREH